MGARRSIRLGNKESVHGRPAAAPLALLAGAQGTDRSTRLGPGDSTAITGDFPQQSRSTDGDSKSVDTLVEADSIVVAWKICVPAQSCLSE